MWSLKCDLYKSFWKLYKSTSTYIITFYRQEQQKAMQSKKTEDQLLKEIFNLTLSFQRKFPVIYNNLLETPLFLNYDQKEISNSEFEEYCKFLKAQLRVFEKEKINGHDCE